MPGAGVVIRTGMESDSACGGKRTEAELDIYQDWYTVGGDALPRTQVYFYQDTDGRAPVREWLRDLRRLDERAHAKCMARIERLAELGHELRRPEADFLREGIYELRAKKGTVNYRILYFFHGRNVAILVHALTKEAAVPAADLARAIERKRRLEASPHDHIHQE